MPESAQPADQPEYFRRLGNPEGRRRFVEDDDGGALTHGAGDGDGLALAAGEVLNCVLTLERVVMPRLASAARVS